MGYEKRVEINYPSSAILNDLRMYSKCGYAKYDDTAGRRSVCSTNFQGGKISTVLYRGSAYLSKLTPCIRGYPFLISGRCHFVLRMLLVLYIGLTSQPY